MGSICCVPARPQTTTGSINGCSNIVDELHCCSTGGFSPPSVSQQWEKHDNSHAYALQMDRNSLSSSSRGSRVGSARFIGHQHTPSDSVFSHGASPSDSFSMSQWASLVPSRSGNFADFITATGDLSSSPSITLSSHKEGVLITGLSPLSSTPESNTSCKQDGRHYIEELSLNPSHQQNMWFYPSLPRVSYPPTCHRQSTDKAPHAAEHGSNSFSSLNGSRHSFRWSRNKGVDSNLGLVDNASDWWSVQTFSELVASSRRERLRWTKARSPSDFGYVLHRKSMEKGANYPIERIRAYSSEAASVAPAVTHRCGLCSRLLSDSSPTNSHRMIMTNDLAAVGVLSCGHVFHSNCLEEVTPEARKQDPPCPQCDPAAKVKVRNVTEPPISSKSGWMANSFHGQSSSRNKLSRIVAADNLSEQEFHCSSSKFKGKVPVQDDTSGEKRESCSSVYHNEKALSRKLLSRRTFSFKGKTLKDVLIGDGGRKTSGTSSQVSPDKSSGEEVFTVAKSIKGKSGSFRYLQSR
ncbi:hypothetical protein O6H91_14G057600 [Diphasiastrum complanatum]|nr:hypothetical protein O6H91_14G057600 [Diphasiastrum complanatum]KAJ7531762.1 hypothetical protein O6H91_14G057600 [Diphasiastrum complanatum]KAJ7531763.1 hypothetical protein O6H91_14G057600 [Diphasiastrum complanatum]KAJ7531764.1 hypothetical protein O6H91_14G057600 [Diphasiastrum complanatum]KAJ7531765.1 hypothetical protein O6H91_14G057600 [Diphasiastrum complanatum]